MDGDVEAPPSVFGDREVMRYVGAARRPLDLHRLRASQARMRKHWERHGFGPLAVVEQTSGRLVGESGLQLLESGPEVEVTYTLARAVWGRGYATEAVRAVLAWGFDGLRLQRLVAVVYPEKAASRRVVEKARMVREGTRFRYGATLDQDGLGIDAWRAVERMRTPPSIIGE